MLTGTPPPSPVPGVTSILKQRAPEGGEEPPYCPPAHLVGSEEGGEDEEDAEDEGDETSQWRQWRVREKKHILYVCSFYMIYAIL